MLTGVPRAPGAMANLLRLLWATLLGCALGAARLAIGKSRS